MSDDSLSTSQMALVLGLCLFAFVGVMLLFGYVDHSHDSSMEQVCDEEFGESADWIGSTITEDGELAICEMPEGDLKKVDTDGWRPASVHSYVTSLIGGMA